MLPGVFAPDRESPGVGHCRIGPNRGTSPSNDFADILRFALDVGIISLTGITNIDRMQTDLDVFDFHLEPGEVILIEGLATR